MKLNNQQWCLDSGFCFRLKEARENAGMTLLRVATAVGTCVTYIFKLEAGETVPNIKRVVDLADLYGVSVDYLCGRKEK